MKKMIVTFIGSLSWDYFWYLVEIAPKIHLNMTLGAFLNVAFAEPTFIALSILTIVLLAMKLKELRK